MRSIKEVSQMLGVTSSYIRRLAREGKVHAVKSGRDWSVDWDSARNIIWRGSMAVVCVDRNRRVVVYRDGRLRPPGLTNVVRCHVDWIPSVFSCSCLDQVKSVKVLSNGYSVGSFAIQAELAIKEAWK